MNVQVDSTPQQGLYFLACRRPNLLETGPTLTNNDCLLTVPFHVNRDVNIQDTRLFPFNHLRHLNGHGVRQLVVHTFEGGFTDKLGN